MYQTTLAMSSAYDSESLVCKSVGWGFEMPRYAATDLCHHAVWHAIIMCWLRPHVTDFVHVIHDNELPVLCYSNFCWQVWWWRIGWDGQGRPALARPPFSCFIRRYYDCEKDFDSFCEEFKMHRCLVICMVQCFEGIYNKSWGLLDFLGKRYKVFVRIRCTVKKCTEGQLILMKLLQRFSYVVVCDWIKQQIVCMYLRFKKLSELPVVFPFPGNRKIKVFSH